MKIKITSKEQLEGIVYTQIKDKMNCVIKIYEAANDDFFYFSSIKINNTDLLISMSAGDVSVGNVIKHEDGKSIMNWIRDKSQYIDFRYANLTMYLDDNEPYDQLNFRQKYLKKHSSVKKKTPILILESNDAIDLFDRFLQNDKCTKLIFSFRVFICDLNHTFLIDLVIDKTYTYNKTCITFSTVRPDIKSYFPDPHDSVWTYLPNNNENIAELKEECETYLNTLFTRCMYVSKEKINIYAYSNCELI